MPTSMADRYDAVKNAGFMVLYADPAQAYRDGRAYLSGSDLNSFRTYHEDMPFIQIDARDECFYGQSPFVEQSNFRCLLRDHGRMFVQVGYRNVNTLGVFLHSASDRVLDIVIGLREGWPIYNEFDLSELESEAVTGSWKTLSQDLYRDLPEALQDLYFECGEDAVRDEFWSLVSAADYYPECAGSEVRWDMDRARVFLITAIRNLKRATLGRAPLTVCLSRIQHADRSSARAYRRRRSTSPSSTTTEGGCAA